MHLIDCFMDTIIELLDTAKKFDGSPQSNEGAAVEYTDVKKLVDRTIAENAYKYKEGGYSLEQYEDAKFAIIALVDEKIMSSNWPHKTQWATNLLQIEYFGTSNAGKEFFDRMSDLSPFSPEDKDVREVFYYCLCLGFTGKYYRQEDKLALAKIRNDAYQSLAIGPGDWEGLDEDELFPDATPQHVQGLGVNQPRSWAPLYIGIPIIFVALAYFALRHDILRHANDLVTII